MQPFRPPVKQFDLLADIREGTHAVLIVDGVFHQTPAVSPSEIMDALRRGIAVYGSSSMGALRAAELEPYGMRGVGEIFAWARSDSGFRDDYPAQVFSNDGGKITPLSVPYVDFVFSLRRLVAQRRRNANDLSFLEQTFRSLYYPDRTLAALLAQLRNKRTDLIPIATEALLKGVSQKRIDAMAALKRVKSDMQDVASLNRLLLSSFAERRSKSQKAKKI